MINDHLMSHGLAETPWGGVGDSGIGRTHAELGFLEMLQTRVVVDDILPGARRRTSGGSLTPRKSIGDRSP